MPGPAPKQTCLACNHPAVVLLDKAIKDGMSDRQVAGHFGFKYPGVIRRHRENHLRLSPGGKPMDAPPAPPPDDPGEPAGDGDPRAELERLIKTLKAQATDDARPEVFRELRLSLEALGKMGANQPLVVRVSDVEGLKAMIAEMHEALKPWPEARAALAEVWSRHRGLGDD